MATITQRVAAAFKRAPRAERHEEKASRTGALVAMETLGQPVWSPRDYGAFAREGFMQNAIVYRSVRMVAEAAASVPLLLYAGDEEIEQHPLLNIIAAPNPHATGTDLLEAWYGFLLVAGNAYLEAVSVGGEVRELHALRPDRMKVVPGADGWPSAYEYTVGGRAVRIDSDAELGVRPVLHVKLFHPANDHYGLSPIEAAATAIDIHNTASSWNKSLLDNSARPSGALVYGAGNGTMTTEQFERLKQELEASYQGAAHAGRPLLLEGGLDWKPLSLTPKDMDFIEAKNAAAREIALAIGVPPMLLGIPGDNTFTDDPYDPGGPTNKGITLKVYAAWLGTTLDAASRARLLADLKSIKPDTVAAIYRKRYFDPARCGELPTAIAAMHFDAAVNHGVGGASRMLQQAVGTQVDGEIGPLTLTAANDANPADVIARYADIRRARYRALPHFWRFGRGWLRRVDATLTFAETHIGRPAIAVSAPGDATPATNTSKPPNPMITESEPTMQPLQNDVPDDQTTMVTDDQKWWGHSKTMWGAIISASATLIPVFGPLVGIYLPGDLVRDVGERTLSAVQAGTALFGTLLTIYGRLTAEKTLTRKTFRVRM